MSIQENETAMKDKCVCENCDNPRILKHFERCEKCGSAAFHMTPRKLNPELFAVKDETNNKKKEVKKFMS